MATLAKIASLKTLYITGPQLGKSAITALKGSNVETLQLGSAVDDDGMAELQHLPNLRWLLISQCKISDRGVAELTKLSRLETISMESEKITDASVDSLAAIASLRYVHIYDSVMTGIGDARFKELRPEVHFFRYQRPRRAM